MAIFKAIAQCSRYFIKF